MRNFAPQMEKDMQSYRLSDLVKIKNGKDHKMLSNGKYPVLGSGGIMRYVDKFLYDKPSVLLPRKGTLDNIQYCDMPFWTVDTLYYTEVNTNLANPYYLYRYLSLLDLSNLDSGTGVPSMTFDNYYGLKIFLPNIEKQTKIAQILQTLDKKITINRQINQNLEAMAKQLYDYWFMQFDFPNEEGKPYKSSGGEMVWNEKLKREIPKEWEVLNLGQITTSYQQGLIRSNNQLSDSSEFGYLKMGDLDGKGQYSLQKLARTNATSEEVFLFSLHKGDFLINVRNSKEIVGKTCLIDYVEENTLFNHMLVRMSFDKVTSFYMNLLFNTDFMYRAMDGLKQGTTTVIALYQEDLYRLPIVVPTKNVMDTFSIIELSLIHI